LGVVFDVSFYDHWVAVFVAIALAYFRRYRWISSFISQ